jgi:hypothetical protein
MLHEEVPLSCRRLTLALIGVQKQSEAPLLYIRPSALWLMLDSRALCDPALTKRMQHLRLY